MAWKATMQAAVDEHPDLWCRLLAGEHTEDEAAAIQAVLLRPHAELPTRMRNWADRHGLTSIREIVLLDPDMLADEPNLGRKTLSEVERFLRCATGRSWEQLRGLVEATPTGSVSPTTSGRTFTPIQGAKAWQSLRETYPSELRETPITRLYLNTRVRKLADAKGFVRIGDFFSLSEHELLREPNVSRGSIKILITALNEFATGVQSGSVPQLPKLGDFDNWLSLLKDRLQVLRSIDSTIITRRTGIDGEPVATLLELGDQLGVTRERVRQIESRGVKQLVEDWWPRPLRARLDGLLMDGATALDVLSQDPFFSEADEFPDAIEFVLDRVFETELYLVKLNERLLIAPMNQDVLDDLMAGMRRDVKQLSFPVGMLTIENIVAERFAAAKGVRAFALESLVEDLAIRTTHQGAIVDGFGKLRETSILSYLRGSPGPVAVTVIHAKFGRGRMPDEVQHLDRGLVGLPSHIPDLELWTQRLVPMCIALMTQDPARQWSATELVDLLADQARLPPWLDAWYLASIIRVDGSLRYLGRLRVALAHDEAPASRLLLRDLMMRLLEEHGRPMTREELLSGVRKQAACSDLLFSINSVNDPFVPVDDLLIGIIARDLPGGMDAMKLANVKLVEELERTQRALGPVTGLAFLKSQDATFEHWTPSSIAATARLPGMLVLARSGSIGLTGWSADRFPTRQNILRGLLDSNDGQVSVALVVALFESHFGVTCTRPVLYNLAHAIGGRLRGDNIIDERLLAASAPPPPSDFPDPLDIPGFPASAVDAFLQACLDPSDDLGDLRTSIDTHVGEYMNRYEQDPRLAPAEVLALASSCKRFLTRAEMSNSAARRIAIAVVRYFVLRDDAEMDFEVGGLDDDIAVADAIAVHLGYDECRVSAPTS